MSAMPDFFCRRCQTWHEPPKCDWDCWAPCRECARPVGFLGAGQPRDGICNRCWVLAEFGIEIPECYPPSGVAG